MLLFAAIHYLSYSRVAARMQISSPAKRSLKIFLALNFLANGGYIAARYVTDMPKPLYALLSVSIGVSFILLLALVFYEALHLLQHKIPLKDDRRRFFKRVSDTAFLTAGAAMVGESLYEGGKLPVVKKIEVKQNRFGGGSYRVVQISDMHIGGLIDREFVKTAVERINGLDADIVAITGDLTDLPIARIKDAVGELAALRSRLGTFYVPGNHEYFHGVKETMDFVESLGITVLRNEAKRVEDLWIAGVYDLFGFRYGEFLPDINAAVSEIPGEAPTLLLAHQPRFVRHLHGFRPSLMLSGHTHGGQIWPFGYLVRLQQPYLKGLHPLGEGSHIYVNSGIGFWGPPMRLGTCAEITLIEWS